VELGLSAVVTAVNRVNSIFEREIGVRFLLVEDNDQIIFTDPSEDGYNDDNPSQMFNHNIDVLDDLIGRNNFDIGHVLGRASQGLSGIAGLGVLCTGIKARGASTHQNPFNDPFILAVVCHEVGHQFNANHTMYSCHNVNPGTAYEPGSGSTIMSYAGICAAENNLQSFPDPQFHANSLEAMTLFSREGGGNDCAVELPTDNIPPQVELPYQNGFRIPILTPFKLEGYALDENEVDVLTYSWEQYNIGPTFDPVIPLGESVGNSPLFRVWEPTEVPYRYFPRIQDYANNISRPFELLPDTSRDLTFRLVVRDNNIESGAVAWEEVRFRSTHLAGPFLVEYPNLRDTLEAGQYFEVQWDVANTNQAPVNSQEVEILLSTDRGLTYPYTLVSGAPNNGSAFVQLPDIEGNLNRIKVRAKDNIFFDISDQNFIITPPSDSGVLVNFQPYQGVVCLPENLVVNINTEGLLGFSDTLNFELLGEFPDGAEIVSLPSQIVVGSGGVIEVDLSQTFLNGSFDFDFILYSDDMDTIRRTVYYEVSANDFRDLELLFPENGSSGIVEAPGYQWVGVNDADGYKFQVATNPAFLPEHIVFETDLSAIDSFRAPISLEKYSIYYWRVRPFNDCGFGEFTPPSVFQTRTLSCEQYESNDVPISVPTISGNTVESILNLDITGEVTEINIPKVKGQQPGSVGDIGVSLVSPDGTEVTLFSRRCATLSHYDLGFDDQSPNQLGCPLTTGGIFEPEEPLANFQGDQLMGEWKLRIRRHASGSAGQLQSWNMEVCANVSSPSLTIVNNDTLLVKPDDWFPIKREVLLTDDSVSSSSQIRYTIVSTPELGRLQFNNQDLGVGDMFTQNDINNRRISYRSDISHEDRDLFTFIVLNERNSAWRGIDTFHVNITEDGISNVIDHFNQKFELTVYPNPTRQFAQFSLPEWENTSAKLVLVNNMGQVIKRETILLESVNKIDLGGLPAGIYYLGLSGERGKITGRVVKE
nr:T9SS type A sorting domain-containing protein [Saprospiraceae bacterium]